MTTENRRKEDMSKAQTEESRESLLSLLNSAMVDKAERETSILPSIHNAYIVTIESVVDDCNMKRAIAKVKSNKGAPGIDGITIEEIPEVMQKQWFRIKQAILDGTYCPSPVRRVEIPKPDGSGFDNWESQRLWIGLSNKQCIKNWYLYSIPYSRNTVTVLDLIEVPDKRCYKLRNISKKDMNG